jgi:hypothetical protein
MSGPGSPLSTLRPSRHESERLIAILLVSLVLHLLVWGGYEAGRKYGWWDQFHWPAWLQRHTPKAQALLAAQQPPREEPLEFVQVDDPSTEAPKNAKYYSNQNSKAADQTNEKDTDRPKLEGHQTDVLHMTDVLHPKIIGPQTPAPKASESKPSEEAQTPKPAGDLTLGKPQPEQPPRPRTLAEARAQQQKQRPEIMAQEDGGARRHAIRASLDAVGSPFGDYDQALIDAIQQYWDDELAKQNFALDQIGKVTIRFKLNYDGTVTEVEELSKSVNEMGSLLCQNAITGPAPFAKWPKEMRQLIDGNFRVITFTFYYY